MDIFSCHLKFDECALRHYRPHDNTTGADKGEGTSGGLNFFDRFRNFKDSSVFRMSLLILTAPSACYTLFCEYFGGFIWGFSCTAALFSSDIALFFALEYFYNLCVAFRN